MIIEASFRARAQGMGRMWLTLDAGTDKGNGLCG